MGLIDAEGRDGDGEADVLVVNRGRVGKERVGGERGSRKGV